ncbi:MAG: formyltransferase family protein [Candidatus Neomarinimicrobiota bacterium]
MKPIDLPGQEVNLPETDNHNIVIVTGTDLRHKRFAYRLQQEFGNLVVAWFEIDNTLISTNNQESQSDNLIKRVLSYYKSENAFNFRKNGIIHSLRIIFSLTIKKLNERRILSQYAKYAQNNETKLFEKEINRLKKYSILNPIKIDQKKINSSEFIEKIEKINPYFFITLGGQLYGKSLLNKIRGVALNQHAGHSPNLKGAFTIEWALYQRKINFISNTIHITTTGADAGPILRRSNPCIFPTDNIHTIFARSVALGTELMIEVVKEIISNKTVIVFKQPKNFGMTFLYKEFSPSIKQSIVRDFKSNWLSRELERLRTF